MLETLLINCEVNLILTCSSNWAFSSGIGEIQFAITDTKLYASASTLSFEDNAKLLE